ncbi:MAG: tetratricopeptide repeat protein, partial [Chloroflexota bacterium]|nr:tetratricopeptide repeat protein [Chloroflexota bacterium]
MTLPTGTVTFFLTDIAGSTGLWEQYPETMREAMQRHDALVEQVVATYSGQVVRPRGEGDSRFAVFVRASDAVTAAYALQQALTAEAWPLPVPLRVRLALHTGEAELRAGDYYSSAVNRCARLRSLANPGQTLLSLTTVQLARENLPEGITLKDLGHHRLKDLSQPEHVFQLVVPGLPNDFPPLQSLGSRPHNLPTLPTPLIGREREMDALMKLLRREDVRLVTITGPGGMGKTRLALQVMAELLDTFQDGAFFVSLAPLSDPALVAPAIVAALGIQERAGQPLVDILHPYLRNKQLLLLLDNFEQVVAAAPLVADLLAAAPQVTVLVTSREVLRVRGEREFPVRPLAIPALEHLRGAEMNPMATLSHYAALELFKQRAQAVKPNFELTDDNVRAVAEICVRLDGLPLAIELAAARVKLFAPQALLGRLENPLKLLTGGPRDLPARQRTLRATIDWSYVLLDDHEKQLFRQLAVFAGGFSLEAAEEVCKVGADLEGDILDTLEALTNKSLLQQGEGVDGERCFIMLETIREYALEQLLASGEAETLRRRHATYFLRLVETAEPHFFGPDLASWLNRVEAEHDNIRAALAWSQAADDRVQLGLQLAGLLWRFWEVRGHITEGRHWLDALLAKREVAPASVRWLALHTAGNLARTQGDDSRARELFEECLALARELGMKRVIAHMLNNLGKIALDEGDYDQAVALYEEALTGYQELAWQWGVGLVLGNLGRVAHAQHEYDRARSLYQESLALFRAEGDQQRIADKLHDLGHVAYDRASYS